VHYVWRAGVWDQHKAAPEGCGRGILQAIAWTIKKF
jgi:hypothetical protein